MVNAIKEQNVQVSSGQLGGLPAVRGQQLNATIIGPSRLQKPEDFGRILLKVNHGSQVRLANVASIELGGQTYAIDSYFNGKPASGPGGQAGAGRQCAGHGAGGARHHQQPEAVLPAGHGRGLSV